MSLNKYFKIPHIRVESVDEYFLLPKTKREYKGFYKVPYGLPVDWDNSSLLGGWNEFYKRIQAEYPIQYFFREWLPSLDNPIVFWWHKFIVWPLRDFNWATKNFIKPCFPRWRKVLPRHKYSDITYVLPKSIFALICDFYHEEVVDGFVDWESDEIHKKFYQEIILAVDWIEKERKVLDEQLQEHLSTATKNRHLDYEERYKEYRKLEQQIKDKETEILKWSIDNREFFWT